MLLRPQGPELDECRASFSLFAAHAIRKSGIPPAAIPHPWEYCPQWKIICEVEEECARWQGTSLDFSDAVPHGLTTVDLDAVDGCTRAWLELLRHESRAFRVFPNGTHTIKGTAYPTVCGTFHDVRAASAAYVKRCARDEIGSGLMETAGQSHGSSPDKVPRRSPKELVDAAKRQPRRSYEKFAGHIGIGKDTLYAITQEKRWVRDESYGLVAQVCKCSPEDLHPRDIPPPKRHRRQ